MVCESDRSNFADVDHKAPTYAISTELLRNLNIEVGTMPVNTIYSNLKWTFTA